MTGLRCLVHCIFLIFLTVQALAQVDSSATSNEEQDTIIVSHPEYSFENDTILGQRPDFPDDSTLLTDTLKLPPTDTLGAKKAKKGDVETTIYYSATDSMFYDLHNRKIYMYGETKLDYGEISLQSAETVVDWNRKTLKSTYKLDSTGRKIGKPIFSESGDAYETDNIVYNFKTRRSLIKGVITQQEGAYMHGEDVKMNEERELFIRRAKYTTCNLADPHFFIESAKLKVIPSNKVVSGPFNMKFREIPTPIWFPFGMFPQPRKKTSGIVFPSYGEEKVRGFFLRDGGYYLGFSQYFDLRLTGDIYSKGGHAINTVTNYKKRYSFSGTMSFNYSNNQVGSEEEPDVRRDYWVNWSHRPESRGNSSFSASVRAGTSTFTANNNLVAQDYQQSISSRFASSVNYSQRFQRIPVNMAVNARHSQNIQTRIVTLSLPEFSMNVNRIYPFKSLFDSKSPFAKISFSHNFVAKNEITNAPTSASGSLGGRINVLNEDLSDRDTLRFIPENFDEFYKQAKLGGRHSIPVSTSFNLFKFISVSPNFNYSEVWYTRELDFTYDTLETGEKGVRIDTLEGFSRAGSWSTGISMNTRFYGTVIFPGERKIQAIRHVITPSVSMSYNPDFSDPRYGVYREVQVDSLENTRLLSKYQGFAYGSPPGGESRTLGFGLQNNLEMKVRTKNDTTQEFKKVKIFDNLSVNSGYNFAADSFKLSNINWSTRTSFLNNKVSVAVNGSFDPYIYQLLGESVNARGERAVQQIKLDKYAWNHGQGLGTLQNIGTNISFSLTGKKGGKPVENEVNPQDPYSQPNTLDEDLIDDSPYGTEEEKEYIKQNPEEYVDFDVPWTFRMQYNITRSKRGYAEPVINQTLTFGGSIALTSKTQVTFNSGFDLDAGEFTQTRIGVSRDLHCWGLNFSWVPFGRYQSFSLVIRPKSSLLQDLKLERRRNFYDFFQ